MRTRLAPLFAILACAVFGLTHCEADPCAGRVRVVTFGDSNTDIGFADSSDGLYVAVSYVSNLMPRPAADVPNNHYQLAGMIEARWRAERCEPIEAVNHGIAGSTSGGGGFGGPDRHPWSSPNPRLAVNGVTRFEAEVLGRGYPWSGGESGPHYPDGPIMRTRAFPPGADDFA